MATAAWPRSAAAPRWRAAAFAVAVAGAVGVGAVRAPGVAAVVVGLMLLAAAISRSPALVFGWALVALSYTPEHLDPSLAPLNHPELQKGLVYAALLAMALVRGIDWRLTLPIVAYVGMAVLSALHGHLAPGLDVKQMASSFVTLTLAWTALAVRWDWERDARYLKVLACLAPICVALGVVLQLAGLHSLWKEPTSFDVSWRLRGASIAAQLALMAFGSCVAAYVCHRLLAWRPARWLVPLNAVILGLTLTRATSVALAVAAVVPILRFALSPMPWWPGRAIARLGLVLGLAAVLAVALVPRFEERNAGGRYYAGVGTFQDPTSGRKDAWKEIYAIAKQSPLFGHGLGAGPITKIQEGGFLAQHNEYLRLFLEGGYIGGGLVLLAMVLVVSACIARAPPFIRLDLAGVAVAWAGLSYYDNTLTSINLTVPLCLVLGIVASRRRAVAGWG